MALLLLLTLDLAPRVAAPPPPTSTQVEAARTTFRAVRAALTVGNNRATVRLTGEEIAQAATLASRVERMPRLEVAIDKQHFTAWSSKRLIGPVWVNLRAEVEPSRQGFPPVSVTIGRLPLGQTLSRWLIGLGADFLRTRGAKLPPLDDMVSRFTIERGMLVAAVHLPMGQGLFARVPGATLDPVDGAVTAAVYCRLVMLSRTEPTNDMAIAVNRAFTFAPATELALEDLNRARLVALAMYAVDGSYANLALGAEQRVKPCGTPRQAPQLAGRADLAKHWSLSAALAVSAGQDVSRSLGEWKELADSRPDGSGFSFVDLSADRSGLAIAREASQADTARATAMRLARASSEDLLPLRALALSEGLTESEFIAAYDNVDSAQFAAAIARIDRVIARSVTR